MDTTVLIQNITAKAKDCGVSVTSACVDSGVGKSFISDIKRGQIPSVAKVQMLASYFGCTTSDLLGEKEDPATQKGDGEDPELLEMLRRVPPERMPEVERYLRFLLAEQEAEKGKP